MPTNKTIYTLGHSNIDFKEFLSLLKGNGIKILADVRSVPFSKHVPQFNRENIEKELNTNGIEYSFMGDMLGGKPKDAECYVEGRAIYERVMSKPTYQNGISKLIEIANAKKTAIMCSEENPARCHRNLLITQTVLSRGLTVLHIRGNGNIEGAKSNPVQVKMTSF